MQRVGRTAGGGDQLAWGGEAGNGADEEGDCGNGRRGVVLFPKRKENGSKVASSRIWGKGVEEKGYKKKRTAAAVVGYCG